MFRNQRTISILSALSIVMAASYGFYWVAVLDEPFGLDSCFRMLVMILLLWLVLPLVRFREYAKSASLEHHDSTRMKRPKFVLSLLTIGMAVSFAKNLSDEMVFNAEFGAILVISLLWMSIPLLNFFWGMKATNKKPLRMALVIAAYYFVWMLFYALNGSTRDEMGAEHMHVYLAPFAMALCSPVVLYGEFCLRRFERWLSLRMTSGGEGG